MTSPIPIIPCICEKEEIDVLMMMRKQGKSGQAGSQRINSQVERQASESRKPVLLKHEAGNKKRVKGWSGEACVRKIPDGL